ncbi:hypothetical protein [Lentilactobacillus rapi]|nr:hypothetical protein [Lentilactobacillus rapi]
MTNIKRSYWKYSLLSLLSFTGLIGIELFMFQNVTFIDRIAFALILMAIPGLWYDFIFRFSDSRDWLVKDTDLCLLVTFLIGVAYTGITIFIHFM